MKKTTYLKILFTFLLSFPFLTHAFCLGEGTQTKEQIFHGSNLGIGVYQKAEDGKYEVYIGNEFAPMQLARENIAFCTSQREGENPYFVYLQAKDAQGNVLRGGEWLTEKGKALDAYTKYANALETLQQGGAVSFAEDVLYEHPGKTLRPGAEGPEVEALQRALKAKLSLGEDFVIDGKYGLATANAVKRFQQIIGEREDGIAGDRTLAKLVGVVIGKQERSLQKEEKKKNGIKVQGEASVTTISYTLPEGVIRPGAEGPEVEALQRALKAKLSLGEDFAVDGKYGPMTRKAVAQLQKIVGVKDDGVYGPMTRKAWLASLGNVSAGAITPSAKTQTQKGEQKKEINEDLLEKSLKNILLRAKNSFLQFKTHANHYYDTPIYDRVIQFNNELNQVYKDADPLYISADGGKGFIYTAKIPSGKYICVDNERTRKIQVLDIRPDAQAVSCL